MSKLVFCDVCYCTPESIAPGQTSFNYGGVDGHPLCSMECRLKWLNETVVERTARIGLKFMDATMMMHMWMSIGRTEDPAFDLIQARRVRQCEQLQLLATSDEVKAVTK